jgi:hypothetical protein
VSSSVAVPRRPSTETPRSLALLLPLALLLVPGLGACQSDRSNLEKLADQGEPRDKPKPADPDEPERPLLDVVKPPPEPEYPLDKDGLAIPPISGAAPLLTPGADSPRVELRLALADDARYRVTTIGMLKLPLFERPVGFAREEELRLGDCVGEGATRSCLLTHEYRGFEAEPPTGETLERDEALVSEFQTSHRIDASGLRITETAVHGPSESMTPAAAALSQVHRMHCLRLPSEAVGVGATWRDACRSRIGGSIVTRELTWRLAKLEPSPEGQRAELEYVGRLRRVDSKGAVRNGEVIGTLFLWVDAGEPHLIRERVTFTIDADKGLTTGTDLRHQFAKLGANDELVRTDGKPFDQPPMVLNDLRAVPNGATRDDEHPGVAVPQ